MAKMLLVTNHYGYLHLNPLNTKDYYEAQNNLIKDKQYILKEMEEKEALALIEKNNGIDPNFKTPKQALQSLNDKDAEIAALRAALEEAKKANPEAEKLRAVTTKASKAPTEPDASAAAVKDPNEK